MNSGATDLQRREAELGIYLNDIVDAYHKSSFPVKLENRRFVDRMKSHGYRKETKHLNQGLGC